MSGQQAQAPPNIAVEYVTSLEAKVRELEKKAKDLQTALDSVNGEFKKTQDVLEAQRRGELIDEYRRKGGTYGEERLSKMTVDEIKAVIDAIDHTEKQVFRSGADFGGKPDPHQKLDNLYAKWRGNK